VGKIRATPMSKIPSMSGTTAVPVATVSADGKYVHPTFNYALRIWWAFYWPVNLIILITAFGFDGLEAVLLQNGIGTPVVWLFGMFTVLFAVVTVVSYLVMHYVLGKKFRNFRVAMVASADPQNPQVVERTFERVIRVWFAYWWRNILFGLILSFVTSIPVGIVLAVFTRMPRAHAIASTLVQVALNGLVGLYIFYNNIIDEKFGDAHVTLLPRDFSAVEPAQANAAAPAPLA
jgi:hypothetical protein